MLYQCTISNSTFYAFNLTSSFSLCLSLCLSITHTFRSMTSFEYVPIRNTHAHLYPYIVFIYNQLESCLLSNNIMDYHIVSQGKTTIPNVDDGEEFTLTDVRHRPSWQKKSLSIPYEKILSNNQYSTSILIAWISNSFGFFFFSYVKEDGVCLIFWMLILVVHLDVDLRTL